MYLGHILCLHHVACCVADVVEEIGVFISSKEELSQVDAAVMVWQQS
jgi:hypothetical protein